MKKLSKEMRDILDFNWKIRLNIRAEGNKLRAEGDKLRVEGDKLCAEGDKLCAEGDKLCAEGNKLYAEGNKLCAEGSKLWAETILHFVGNVKMEWKNWDKKTQSCECLLETGDVFKL